MECEWFSFLLDCDIPNWLTMIIELMIGGFVAIIFFIIQQKQGKKIQTVIDENENSKIKRRNTALGRLEIILTHLWSETKYIEALLANFYGDEFPEGWSDKDFAKNELTEKWLIMIKDQSKHIGEDIRNWTLTSYDLLNSDLLYALQCIYTITSKSFMLDKSQSEWDTMGCDGLLDWLEKILEKDFHHETDNLGMVGPNTGSKEIKKID